MTLAQISAGIDQNIGTWGMAYKDLIQRVPDDPRIMAKLQDFTRHVIGQHFSELHRVPSISDFQQAIALSSVAAFRLGLLVGLKLDHPGLVHASEVAAGMDLSALEPETQECEVCYGNGSVCGRCGKSVNMCECGDGNRNLFDPVCCDICNGRGIVSQ